MTDDRLLHYINDSRLIHLLQQMIQIKSCSGDEQEISKFMALYLRRIGLQVKLEEVVPGRNNVIAVLKGTGEGPSILYNGHLDTNPVGLGWTVDPFGGTTDDKYIYGIGVSNMKASDAAFVEAVHAVSDSGVLLKGDIKISLVIGELQGGIGTVKMLENNMKADWFINGEPTDLSLLTLHAGSCFFRIDVYGVSRHMSKQDESVNAILQMSKFFEEMKHFQFSHAVKAEYAGLNRFNIGTIRGGLGLNCDDSRPPQVPDYCSVKIAFRYAPSQSEDSVQKDLQSALDRIRERDPKFRFKLLKIPRPLMGPFEGDPDSLITKTLQKYHRQIIGNEPYIGAVSPYKFYGTDAGHLSRYGIKGIVYGCGGKYNTMPDEKVSLRDIQNIARIYAMTVSRICMGADS